MLVDTGSRYTLISKETYEQLNLGCLKEERDIKLSSYSRNKIILLGSRVARFMKGEREIRTKNFIVNREIDILDTNIAEIKEKLTISEVVAK